MLTGKKVRLTPEEKVKEIQRCQEIREKWETQN